MYLQPFKLFTFNLYPARGRNCFAYNALFHSNEEEFYKTKGNRKYWKIQPNINWGLPNTNPSSLIIQGSNLRNTTIL